MSPQVKKEADETTLENNKDMECSREMEEVKKWRGSEKSEGEKSAPKGGKELKPVLATDIWH